MIKSEYRITDREKAAIEAAINAGMTVEILPMREGNLVIRTVKKKQIEIPTV